jgi:hypothetical protein
MPVTSSTATSIDAARQACSLGAQAAEGVFEVRVHAISYISAIELQMLTQSSDNRQFQAGRRS